jgi:hypothetical protein
MCSNAAAHPNPLPEKRGKLTGLDYACLAKSNKKSFQKC